LELAVPELIGDAQHPPVEGCAAAGAEGADDDHAGHHHDDGAEQAPPGRANPPPHPRLPADPSLDRKADD
jgi:hypothetical protein